MERLDGYHGIWFTLDQFYPYGDKYSGGLGTYTAKHCPLAIHDTTVAILGQAQREGVSTEIVARRRARALLAAEAPTE